MRCPTWALVLSVNFLYCTTLSATIISFGIKNIYVTAEPRMAATKNIKKPSKCYTTQGQRKVVRKTCFKGNSSWECNTRHTSRSFADACICNDNKKNNNLARTWRTRRKVSHIMAISHKLLKKRLLCHMPPHTGQERWTVDEDEDGDEDEDRLCFTPTWHKT